MLSLSLHALGRSEHNPIRYILQRLGCHEGGVSILVFNVKKYCQEFFGNKIWIKIQFEEMEAALPHKQLTLLKLLTLLSVLTMLALLDTS